MRTYKRNAQRQMHILPRGYGKAVKRFLATGRWQKHVTALAILSILGLTICSQRINTAQGFLTDDCTHLENSYLNNLQIIPYQYLPGVRAVRPIGRDAITVLLRLFGENDTPIIWTLLSIHIISTLLVWQTLYQLSSSWWASLTGSAFFMLNVSAYLPIYWPSAISDLVSAFFLACLLLLLAVFIHPGNTHRPWLLMLTIPLLIAAVKTKESSIVAILPLFLMVNVLFPKRNHNKVQEHFSLGKEVIRRLLNMPRWNVIWSISSILITILLALTVRSVNGGATDPNQPYYSEYSYRVIGRSFGYFLATLAFNTDEAGPMRPTAAYIILFFALVGALLISNRLMILGWIWFVVFLLPLAALKNHFGFAYYPYPANIGTALFIAGVFRELEVFWSRFRATRPLRYLLPVVFIALLAQQSYTWLKESALMKWYDGIHARRVQVVQALTAALPQPSPHTKLVLVFPGVFHLDKNMSSFIRVVYHDLTLTCEQFTDEQEAEKFLAAYKSGNVTLAVWRGGYFELRANATTSH
jgi:hypothetical protein